MAYPGSRRLPNSNPYRMPPALDTKAFGLKETSRIKAFVFSFISVPAKWIMTARQYVLNIYTENRAYARPFKTGFG